MTTWQQNASASRETDQRFAAYRFLGSHREIGQQYGETCRDLIHRHFELAVNRLRERSGVNIEDALDRAMHYRPFVQDYASFLDEEIQGVAEGAGLSLPQAYLLQLRAEAARPVEDEQECTTFAVLANATADGVPMIGQNADLPAFYRDISVIAEIRPDTCRETGVSHPAVLMLLPAGQVSYIGINDRGMGIFANYLSCDGWQYGFPRYLFSRLVLTEETVDNGIERIRSVKRASSRNLIMLDAHGTAADLETTPTRDARIDPEDGLLAHSNHYVAEALAEEERSTGGHISNSRIRLERMHELLREQRGRLTVETMQTIMRDRACHPDNLSRWLGDEDGDMVTFASVIAEPSEGRMWIAVGPPHENDYHCYALSA
ncbi:MAG: hypothetical protein IT333_04730 [Thermomicrobiales bacterium]|nr:hypothetical protein [Thermomicrobiales bacterium]